MNHRTSSPKSRTREERLANLRYLVRARAVGTFEWTCPYCGFYNRSKVHRRSFVVTCLEEICKRTYGFGFILYVMQKGNKTIPRDRVIPTRGMRDAFDIAEVDTWDQGQLSHRINIIPEEMLLQLIEKYQSSGDPTPPPPTPDGSPQTTS